MTFSNVTGHPETSNFTSFVIKLPDITFDKLYFVVKQLLNCQHRLQLGQEVFVSFPVVHGAN